MHFSFRKTDALKTVATPLRAFLALTAIASLFAMSALPAAAQVKCSRINVDTAGATNCYASEAACKGPKGDVVCACQPDPSCVAAAAPAASATAKTELVNPLNTSDIRVLAARAIKIFTGIAGSLALAMFVYGGFMMVTAAGEEKKYSAGKQALVWAVIGLVVMFGSYAVLNVIFGSLGIQ